MSLLTAKKSEVIKKYATGAKDTGSPEVQIAVLTQRINQLTEHMKVHRKDMGSRRGLLIMVSNRRSLLNYLKKVDSKRYEKLIDSLGLRR